jgi:hypothetical protein
MPPWDTGDGAGAWLSDLCPPKTVAAGGTMMVIGAERGESGYSIIGTDIEGRKLWGERTMVGVQALAADAEYVYILLAAWDVPPALARLELATGAYAPFETADGPQLRVPLFDDGVKPPWIPMIAVDNDRIAVPLSGENGMIRFYDKRTAAAAGEMPLPKPACLAFGPTGTLYVWSDGAVVKLAGGRPVPFIKKTPEWVTGMAVDAAGWMFLADRTANQVRVYDSSGAFLRAIGREGGRPATGRWQPDGMRNPSGIALDATGRLWVAEEDNAPRRVSVWSPYGGLVKDFLWPTGYGGTGANADPDDKTRVFGSGCEWKLDYGKNEATVVSVLGDVSGELLKVGGREYFVSKNGRLYLRAGDALKAVAAMGNVRVQEIGNVADIPLPAPPGGTHGYVTISFVWSDLNDDGTPQAGEVVSGSPWSGWKDLKYSVGVSGYFGSYWLDEKFDL